MIRSRDHTGVGGHAMVARSFRLKAIALHCTVCPALHWVPLTSDQLRGTSVHAWNPELERMQYTTVETGVIQAAP